MQLDRIASSGWVNSVQNQMHYPFSSLSYIPPWSRYAIFLSMAKDISSSRERWNVEFSLAESNLNLDPKSAGTYLFPPSPTRPRLLLCPPTSCSFAFDVFSGSSFVSWIRENLSIFHRICWAEKGKHYGASWYPYFSSRFARYSRPTEKNILLASRKFINSVARYFNSIETYIRVKKRIVWAFSVMCATFPPLSLSRFF